MTADRADRILDELIAIDAKIIYIGMPPTIKRFSTSGSSRRRSAMAPGTPPFRVALGGYLL